MEVVFVSVFEGWMEKRGSLISSSLGIVWSCSWSDVLIIVVERI